uniref:E3 ubiquitin-protein ligase n=1 Tax=Gadus morhua TaxID=8049 RepID=A0A8C5ATY3_GADMO
METKRAAPGGLTDGPISNETRKAFIDLCRCARKEMSKLDGGPKRKRNLNLLPCVGVLEASSREGSLLAPPPPQPRRSQRQQQQRFRRPTDEEACVMLHEVSDRKDLEPGTAAWGDAEANNVCSICMGDVVEKTTLERRACPVLPMVPWLWRETRTWKLPGHEGYGCICIIYSFPPGLASKPGVRYPGTDRVAYLPDSPDGNRVLGLLRRTSLWGGPRFGYPDPTYMVRVTEELREKGITAD